jgi:hypothetical protein
VVSQQFLLLFFFTFESGSHSEAQAALEIVILLPQPPECWDYGVNPLSHLIYVFTEACLKNQN